MLVKAPGELTMAQVMVRSDPAVAAGDSAAEWAFGEYAVLAGWAFFGLGLLKGVWEALRWSCSPRKPGSEEQAERTPTRVCSQCGRSNEGEQPRREQSPRRESSRRRQFSVTPEKKPSEGPELESPGRSPEIQRARAQILEAMVQRAQPVVQDLHDMHRLGGVGPVLRRGSRIQ